MMTLEQQIAYWKKAYTEAKNKEAALVAFGVYAGLTMALVGNPPEKISGKKFIRN